MTNSIRHKRQIHIRAYLGGGVLTIALAVFIFMLSIYAHQGFTSSFVLFGVAFIILFFVAGLIIHPVLKHYEKEINTRKKPHLSFKNELPKTKTGTRNQTKT